MAAFGSLVKWQIGDDTKALFWKDRWINEACIEEIAPIVVARVRTQVVNRKSVKYGRLYMPGLMMSLDNCPWRA